MSIEINCDNCKDGIDIGNETYCAECYVRLKDEIKDLEAEIKDFEAALADALTEMDEKPGI